MKSNFHHLKGMFARATSPTVMKSRLGLGHDAITLRPNASGIGLSMSSGLSPGSFADYHPAGSTPHFQSRHHPGC
jgi:hypothetical protein